MKIGVGMDFPDSDLNGVLLGLNRQSLCERVMMAYVSTSVQGDYDIEMHLPYEDLTADEECGEESTCDVGS